MTTLKRDIALKEKFLSRLQKGPPEECWTLSGKLNSGGYTNVYACGKTVGGHRLSLFVFNGEHPPGDMCVCHKCDNRACVNPHHLFIGENSKRQYAGCAP